MFKDDDEEEENTFGVTRYPCMPSLVALQQMRNRLHLAFLGRKLMKWTALATGRELRRIAQELYVVYDGFAEDLRNAFILLARSRYFYTTLNTIVTEDIGKKAGVIVQQSGKTVSGVKIVQFEIYETEYPPYPHLGIEKGGQTILETKKAWLELLRRLIMMLQLRAGFLMVELANRNANKKTNVLAKIVIPRTNVTMAYINNELEELAREEFFRLKKVLEIKRRMYGDKTGKKKAKEKKEDDEITITSPLRIEEAKALEEEEILEQNFSEEKEAVQLNLDELSQNKLLQDKDVMELMKQIGEIVVVTKHMDKIGLLSASVDNFIRTAEELKDKLNPTPKPQTAIDELEKEMDDFVREAMGENLDEFSSIHELLDDDIDINKLCEACKVKYKRKNMEDEIFEEKEQEELKEKEQEESKETIKTKQSSTQDTHVNASDAELCESCKTRCKRKNMVDEIFDEKEQEESKETIKTKQPSTQDTHVNESDAELFEVCKDKYKRKNMKDEIFEEKEQKESKETITTKQPSTQDTHVNESDAELGTVETVVKEITKIVKTKNEDGSIRIQKKVIKMKTEIKAPVRLQRSQVQSKSNNPSSNVSYQASSTSFEKSNSYTGSKTVGVVRLSNSEFKDKLPVSNIKAKMAKSEILGSFSPMSDPVERFCMSSVTLLSTDLDFDCAIYNDTYNKTNSDWLCLKASNPMMIEEIISSCEPDLCNMSPTTNTENCRKSSSADINLDKKCSKKLGLSVSFNIKSPSFSASLDEINNKDKNK